MYAPISMKKLCLRKSLKSLSFPRTFLLIYISLSGGLYLFCHSPYALFPFSSETLKENFMRFQKKSYNIYKDMRDRKRESAQACQDKIKINHHAKSSCTWKHRLNKNIKFNLAIIEITLKVKERKIRIAHYTQQKRYKFNFSYLPIFI